ncbi:hypothetical protein JLK41_12210 [Ectopseudomonas khazarica]|uniref:hypothetical protein n=1 Tax=Ectopseudomonas khazarica TaxID=2502979 RepID=UPI001AEFCB94|nr:hypothetical protein [Pseudomonas khazarica]QTS88858.1 hypothetical protein JLK41_12210 [Pseudomonas khazarica]
MPILRYLSVALASALVAAYAAAWIVSPAPLERTATTIPPLRIDQSNGLALSGGWRTVAGYDHGTTNASEIICNRERQTCFEAYASLLHHDSGEDLEAQAFDYEVTTWDDQRLVAINTDGMGECLQRFLYVDLVGESATLEWHPGEDGCEGDIGKAVLVGDPL